VRSLRSPVLGPRDVLTVLPFVLALVAAQVLARVQW
jgi:hypothetical protein